MVKNISNRRLILFTLSFPYGKVEQFLETEINYLALKFDEVIIIPSNTNGERREIPPNVRIELDLASANEKTNSMSNIEKVFNVIIYKLFFQELIKRPLTLIHPKEGFRLINYIIKSINTKKWIESYIKQNQINNSNIIYYTYWITHVTYGIGLAKKRYPNIKLISRAHGADLYEERYYPPYLPCQLKTLQSIDELYLISEHGRRYLVKKYPTLSSKFEIYRLGVKEPGFRSQPSYDGKLRIVSCSSIVPVKRLDLLVKGIAFAAQSMPQKEIEWVHIGDGPLMSDVINIAKQTLPKNVRYSFCGYLENKDVIRYYKEHCVDIFMNVSESEGVPVSIMEAQSCGIPVIATSVGGTPEIVSNENGELLSPNASYKEIGDALIKAIKNRDQWKLKREISRKNWEINYNSDKNYKDFTEALDRFIKLDFQ